MPRSVPQARPRALSGASAGERADQARQLAGFDVVVDDEDLDADEALARQRIATAHQPDVNSVEIRRHSSQGLSGSRRCTFAPSGTLSPAPSRSTTTIGALPPSSGLRART